MTPLLKGRVSGRCRKCKGDHRTGRKCSLVFVPLEIKVIPKPDVDVREEKNFC